jgi:ABC-type nitrate/sulfonate/bicarbonate transport system substrate-binding protein
MAFLMILSMWLLILWPGGEAWSQKSLPTVRLGTEATSGTNSHYYVTKQLGLFQKHGVNVELIAFQAGTIALQSLFAGDL